MNNTESKTLSLAFIGGAVNSAVGYAHYVSATMDNEWDVVAGCFSKSSDINHKSGSEYGVDPERVYDTWQELLDSEKGEIDAVVILTPTPSHCDIVVECLDKGIPVISEKALASNTDEINKIICKKNEKKGFLAVTYNYSGYPMMRELRDVIQSGKLGKVLHFQAEMPQEGFVRLTADGGKPTPQEWRLSDARVPTIYLDLAVHLHQLLNYLIGKKPIDVIATQGSYGWFNSIVDNVNAICRYSDGVQGSVWFSKSALGHRNGLRLRIYGSEASAEWFQMNPEELLLSYNDGRREIVDRASGVSVASLRRYERFKAGHPAGFVEAFANLYSDIAESLRLYQRTGTWESSDVFGAELALEGMQFLESMALSVKSNAWEKV